MSAHDICHAYSLKSDASCLHGARRAPPQSQPVRRHDGGATSVLRRCLRSKVFKAAQVPRFSKCPVQKKTLENLSQAREGGVGGGDYMASQLRSDHSASRHQISTVPHLSARR